MYSNKNKRWITNFVGQFNNSKQRTQCPPSYETQRESRRLKNKKNYNRLLEIVLIKHNFYCNGTFLPRK